MSSTAFGNDCAYYVYFDSDGVYPDDGYTTRNDGYSVRLVTEVK